MKKETVEKGTKLLGQIANLKARLDRLTLGPNGYVDHVQIRAYVDRGYLETYISMNKEGYSGDFPISPAGGEILGYLTTQYHKAVYDLLKAELEKLQKEFDDLKD